MSDDLTKLREAVARLPKNKRCNPNREADILAKAITHIHDAHPDNVLGKYVWLVIAARRLVEQEKEPSHES